MSNVLDHLNRENHAIFVLRFVNGLSLAGVAAATHLSVSTVKRRLVTIWWHVYLTAKRDPYLAEYL